MTVVYFHIYSVLDKYFLPQSFGITNTKGEREIFLSMLLVKIIHLVNLAISIK